MNEADVEAKIDQIRELCRETIRAMRDASSDHRYGAALDQAVARRRLCLQVFDAWYASLSGRAQMAFRRAADHPWDGGDSLSRLTMWDLLMAPNCGKKTVSEIVDSLRALGIELPERTRGAVMVFPPEEGPS